MKPFRFRIAAALLLSVFAPCAAVGAGADAQAFDLKAGQEVTFAVTVGAAQPKDGEITVGLAARDKTLYEQVTVTEKTAVPINFLATGLVGGTKIDEAVLCGRIDAPVSQRIGAMSWKVRLHDFEAAKDGVKCE
jgi:hypothetical protein